MKRSLVLAGGGMRVAWQTGVVQALMEHGLTFQHVDGTSGGIMTAGMLLSGQQPAEMGRRWSDLDVSDFTSLLPVRDYLRGPWGLPGLGDADGVVHKVFPHLGIDCEAIRSSPLEGTFNVADFVTKTCVAVPNTEVDDELLAAGMSLPLVMPPLRRGDRVWTDAVWVKDANVTEALRRGARRGVAGLVHRQLAVLGGRTARAVRAHDRDECQRCAVRRARRGPCCRAVVPAARRTTTPPAPPGQRALRRADQHRHPGGVGLPRRVGLPRPGGPRRCRPGRLVHRDDRATGRRPDHRAAARPGRRRGPDAAPDGRARPRRAGTAPVPRGWSATWTTPPGADVCCSPGGGSRCPGRS